VKDEDGTREQIWYRVLYEEIPSIYFTVDTDGRVLSISSFGAEQLGYTIEELIRQPILKVIYLDDRKAIMQQMIACLQNPGYIATLELRKVRKDGTVLWMKDMVRAVRLTDCTVVLIVCNDITQSKHIEQRLRLLSEAVEEAPSGVQIVDLDGRIVFSNKAVKAIYGFSPEEFKGKHVNELNIDPEFASKVILPTIKEMGRWSGELIVRHKDGRAFPIWLTTSMIKDDRGEPIAMVGIMTDITERKRAEEELAQRTAELARSNAELEQFAYIASHDLQEPLRMVSGFTQLLERRYRGKLDRSADEFIAYIMDGTSRMQRMIEDLLAYSRVGTRGKPFELIDCEDALNQSMANLKVAIEHSGAVITRDPLPAVTADASQMIQLFQNLISNAIKFRREEPLRVHISDGRKGDEWVFSVKDNGIGIAPEFMGRLFQIFQREYTSEYPGTGIGLAICKRIVERHSGRIWAESVQGRGSTFYFTIPVRGDG